MRCWKNISKLIEVEQSEEAMKNFLSIVVIWTLLSIVPCTFSLSLKGEYSEMGIYKLYNIKSAFTLKCVADEIVDVHWFKDEQPVADVKVLEDRYEISKNVSKEEKTVSSEFKVEISGRNDSGRYSCVVKGDRDNLHQEFHVVAQIAIKTDSNVEVVEEETARIKCTVVGYRPIVEWLLPDTANLSRISYENDTEIEGDQGNILVIENTDRIIDRANYVCQAYSADEFVFKDINKEKVWQSTTFLRVKDKYAALYPLTGLIIVIVLFVIIVVVSEAHRKKLEAQNEDETPTFEENEPLQKVPSVRQRKQ